MTTTTFDTYLRGVLGLSPNTVLRYTKTVAAWTGWLGNRPPTHDAAREWLSAIENPKSRRVHAAGLKAWFAWLDPRNPLAVRVRVGQSLPKPLTLAELHRAVTFSQGKRRLMVLTLAFSGLRLEEFISLRPQSIMDDAPAIRVTGKGDKERVIDIPPTLHRMLQEEAKARRQGYLFRGQKARNPMHPNTVYHAMREIGMAVGIPDLHPHRLRHTYATWLYALTRDPFYVARQMGHVTIQTTMGYAGMATAPAGITTMEDLLRWVSS